jgi:hypothetical protein
MMHALMPNHPLRPREVEPDFREERDAAAAAGFEVVLYSHEHLLEGNGARAVSQVPMRHGPSSPCVMRGWMISEAQYALLHSQIATRGYELINTAAAYAEAHYLPLAYPLLDELTPKSVWTDACDLDAAWLLYEAFGERDALVKDWVKSAKHRWDEACFLPARSTREHFMRVLRALMDDRGRLFEHGFVLRRFVPLVTSGHDLRGHPVTDEARLFFVDGELLIPPVLRPPEAFLERVSEPVHLDRHCADRRRGVDRDRERRRRRVRAAGEREGGRIL